MSLLPCLSCFASLWIPAFDRKTVALQSTVHVSPGFAAQCGDASRHDCCQPAACKLLLPLKPARCCRWMEERAAPGGSHLQKLPVPVMLLFGACSGLVAQTATYPFDVVRRQMQVQGISTLDCPPAMQIINACWNIVASVDVLLGVLS